MKRVEVTIRFNTDMDYLQISRWLHNQCLDHLVIANYYDTLVDEE